jgi:hypothetical protein
MDLPEKTFMHRIPRFLKLLVGSLVAIAILTGIMLLQGPKRNGGPLALPPGLSQISSSPSAKPLSSLLVIVTNSKQQIIAGSVLLQNDQNRSIAVIDPNSVVDLREFGLHDLKSATTEATATQVLAAFNVASGLSIDGVLNLSEIGFGALLDSVGGMSINSPTVIRLNKTPTGQLRLIRKGSQHLDGTTAEQYAVLRLPGESAAQQGQRFVPALRTVLDQLPTAPQKISAQLMSLGQAGKSNLPNLDVAQFLATTRGEWAGATQLNLATVPSGLRRPATKNWMWLNPGAIHSNFVVLQSNALWADYDQNYRVYLASSGRAGRIAARELLSRGSVYFVDGGSTGRSAHSHLITTDAVPQEVIANLKSLLNLPDLAVTVVAQISTGTQMQLDLGQDFEINQEKGSVQ